MYYVLVFETGKRDNIIKLISEPVEKKAAETIKSEYNKTANLNEQYADLVKAPGKDCIIERINGEEEQS